LGPRAIHRARQGDRNPRQSRGAVPLRVRARLSPSIPANARWPYGAGPRHSDNRGHFVELMRAGISGQTSFSTTRPGITRGEHFHTRKIERFAVILGKARIQLRRIGTNEVLDFELDGENPSYVDMPIWYTHNIKNIGQEELITVFWINEAYNPENPDTWFEKVELD